MSHAGTILGISELEIERVHRHDFIEVWAKPTKKPLCKHCESRHLRIKATHKRTVKHTRQGNQVLTLHLKVPKYHCRCCGRYFRHPFVGIRPRYRASECFRLEVFEAHHGGVTQRGISRTHRISPTTVERWYQSHISQKYKEIISRPCPEMLGIDEHFFTRKKGYATTLVDLRNRNVFDVKLGRSELSLRSYLRHLPGKENVRLIAMDLSETYRSIAKKYFPNATIVADRFHVVRLINHHFLKAWQIQHPEGRKNRGLLSLMRRHQWRLNEDNRANLDRYLANYPVLRALYITKQKLIRFVLMKTMNQNRMEKKATSILRVTRTIASKPTQSLSEVPDVLATTDSGNVALYTEQRRHRRLPQQNGNDIEKSVWF